MVSADPGDHAIVGGHQGDVLKRQALFAGLFQHRRLVSYSPGRISLAQGVIKASIALTDVMTIDTERAVNAKRSTIWQQRR